MRVGFVGLGRVARMFHVPALKRVPGAVVVGGWDAVPAARDSWTGETGFPAFARLDDLLAAGPDVALIATPPDSHLELCLWALDNGLHVVCEKPFVATAGEADQVLAAAAAAGRQVAVNHQFREKPIFRVLRERIAAREYGRLAFCQVWQLMDLAPWDEPTAWRAGMSDRVLFEGGVHLVDLLVGFFGEEPEAVFARRSAGFHEQRDADPVHLVVLEFPGGRLGQITIDRLCQAATRYLEVRAECERASLRASLGGRALVRAGMKRAEATGLRVELGAGGLAWAEQGVKRRVLARNPRDAGVHGTARLLEEAFAAFREGREPSSSAREARTVIAIIEAAYRSAETGERVELEVGAKPSSV
jgi:UDP-N-acetyl-2-amino-2-deoxyglucuronate dehydrogenase